MVPCDNMDRPECVYRIPDGCACSTRFWDYEQQDYVKQPLTCHYLREPLRSVSPPPNSDD